MARIDLHKLLTGHPVHKLWALVLLLAIKDQAVRIHYRPKQRRRKFVLSYEVDNVTHELIPPPRHFSRQLLQTIRDFIRPIPWWSWFIPRRRQPVGDLSGEFVICARRVELARVSASVSAKTVLLEISSASGASAAAATTLKEMEQRQPGAICV